MGFSSVSRRDLAKDQHRMSFVSGPDFSRAGKVPKYAGFSPCLQLVQDLKVHSYYAVGGPAKAVP